MNKFTLPDGEVVQFPEGVPRDKIVEALNRRIAEKEAKAARANEGGTERVVGDVARSFLQGQSFGFGDELAALRQMGQRLPGGSMAGLPGMPPFAGEAIDIGRMATSKPETRQKYIETYKRGVTQEGARNALIPPAIRIPGEIAGAISTGGLGAGGAARMGRTLLGRGLRGGVVGVLEGGLAGLGFTEGNLQERLKGAARGAQFGGLIGAAAPIVIGGLGAAARGVRRASGGGRRGLNRAEREVAGALQRDEMTPTRLARRLEMAGDKATIADVGGANTRGLLRKAGNLPGPGKQRIERLLESRQLGQGARVREAIETALNPDGKKFIETVDQIINERAQKAAPLYEAARKGGGDIGGAAIQKIIRESPRVRQAIARAKREVPELGSLPDTHIKVLDMAYKFLGGQANKIRQSGDRVLSRAVNDVRENLKQAIIRKVPIYREALETFSDRSRLLDALENGRKFIRQESDVTRRELMRMPEAEREMFLIGATRAIQEVTEKTADTANVVRRIFGTTEMRNKIRVLFPAGKEGAKAFRAFQKQMLAESKFTNTRNAVLAGSRTAPLAAEMADLGPVPQAIAQAGTQLATQGPRAAGSGLVGRMVGKAMEPRESVRLGLSRALLSSDQAANRQTIGRIASGMVAETERRMMARALRQGTAIPAADPNVRGQVLDGGGAP